MLGSPVTTGQKWTCILVFGSLYLGLYMLTNQYQINPPRQLPLLPIDRDVPFIPMFVWLYISEYLFLPIAFLNLREPMPMIRMITAFVVVICFSTLIFVLWPTTYPREMFELSADAGIHGAVMAWLWSTDEPVNCLPSLHAATCLLVPLAFLEEQRHKLAVFLPWGISIGVSTLFVKQHYLVDVLGGWATALMIYSGTRMAFAYLEERRGAPIWASSWRQTHSTSNERRPR